MTQQLSLFESKKRFMAFKRFHEENPTIFELFKRYANEALQTQHRKYFGARMIGERIRWYTSVETNDPQFKICNNHWPYYARLLMLRYREFDGFFQRRDRHFDVDDEELKRIEG